MCGESSHLNSFNVFKIEAAIVPECVLTSCFTIETWTNPVFTLGTHDLPYTCGRLIDIGNSWSPIEVSVD